MPQSPYYAVNQNAPAALLTLTAASVGTNSANQTNASFRGVILTVNITALGGTSPTLTVTIEGQDPVSGGYYTVLASAALSATGLTTLVVFPGVAVTANESASTPLPVTWRVATAIAGTSPAVTATIGAALIV